MGPAASRSPSGSQRARKEDRADWNAHASSSAPRTALAILIA